LGCRFPTAETAVTIYLHCLTKTLRSILKGRISKRATAHDH